MSSAEARNRPFDPKVVEQARALAARYHIHVDQDGPTFVGTVAEFPGVLGSGPSKAAALDATRDLLKWAVAYLIETGRTPSPKS